MTQKKKTVPPPVDHTPSINFAPTIEDRLRYLDVTTLVDELCDAIDDASEMAGSLNVEEMETRRTDLEALRQTVLYLFGRESSS